MASRPALSRGSTAPSSEAGSGRLECSRGLPQPGTLILGPEKPGPSPTLPVCMPAEGTSARTARGAAPRPKGAGPAGCHLSRAPPVWELAMMSPWGRGKPAPCPSLLSSLTPPLQQDINPKPTALLEPCPLKLCFPLPRSSPSRKALRASSSRHYPVVQMPPLSLHCPFL